MRVDWVKVERDFRAGLKTHRVIASEHGVSHTAIQKKAKAEGWTRDLNARIQAKAEEQVAKAAVASEVASTRAATDRQIVEANAEAIVAIRLAHRQDITRLRRVTLDLLGKLESADDPLRDLARINTELTNALKSQIGLEREAFGIGAVPDKPAEDDIDLNDAARRIAFLFHNATVH